MHFFNPVPMMALVEIIRGLQTSDATHAAVEAMAKAPRPLITVKNSPGFVVNRILVPMINEAFFVLAEGLATPEDIDAGMKPVATSPSGPSGPGRHGGAGRLPGGDGCLSGRVRRQQVPRLPAAEGNGGGGGTWAARPDAASTPTDPAPRLTAPCQLRCRLREPAAAGFYHHAGA